MFDTMPKVPKAIKDAASKLLENFDIHKWRIENAELVIIFTNGQKFKVDSSTLGADLKKLTD
jgi:hypothetical protein